MRLMLIYSDQIHRAKYCITILLILSSNIVLAKNYRLELLAFKQPAWTSLSEAWAEHPAEPERRQGKLMSVPIAPRDLFYYRKQLEKHTLILGQSAWRLEQNHTIEIKWQQDQYQLWGYLNNQAGRYITLRSDLLLEVDKSSLPYAVQQYFSGPIARFPIKENRRLQPGFLYYYDHPLIGLLARIVAE